MTNSTTQSLTPSSPAPNTASGTIDLTTKSQHLPTPRLVAEMRRRLLAWFDKHKRPLPWREHYAPYEVLVSEVMLQQTQMERGVAYFQRWMRTFPDLESLARADEEQVLRLWEGLGYYNRARNLQRTARKLLEQHQATLPQDEESLLALPGIGPYTAGAIRSLAFNQDVPAIDANVERVLSRMFDLDKPVKDPQTHARIVELSNLLLPPGKARLFNEAMMDLGAMVCSKKPKCADCPLEALCESRRLNIAEERPVPAKSMQLIPLEVVTSVLVHQEHFFIQKRLPKGAWPGLWEFPGGRIEPGETAAQAASREFEEETEFIVRPREFLGVIRHGYTKYRVRLHCFICTLADNPGTLPTPRLHAATEYRWVPFSGLLDFAFPAGHRKLIDQLACEPGLGHVL